MGVGIRVIERREKYARLVNAELVKEQSLTLDTEGRQFLEAHGSSSVATTFHLDASPDNITWINDIRIWTDVMRFDWGGGNAYRFVRLRSDAAGTERDRVTLVLTSM